MKRLFELGCLYSSQILSYTNAVGGVFEDKSGGDFLNKKKGSCIAPLI
jgi:hypothetical protein